MCRESCQWQCRPGPVAALQMTGRDEGQLLSAVGLDGLVDHDRYDLDPHIHLRIELIGLGRTTTATNLVKW